MEMFDINKLNIMLMKLFLVLFLLFKFFLFLVIDSSLLVKKNINSQVQIIKFASTNSVV